MLEPANILSLLNRSNTPIECKLHSIDIQQNIFMHIAFMRDCLTGVYTKHVSSFREHVQIWKEEIDPLQINFDAIEF